MHHLIPRITIPVRSFPLYPSILFRFKIDDEIDASSSKPAAKKQAAAPAPSTDRKILRKFHSSQRVQLIFLFRI